MTLGNDPAILHKPSYAVERSASRDLIGSHERLLRWVSVFVGKYKI